MKKILPTIEILIRNLDTQEYRWVKICGNTAYHNNDGRGTSHFKIDGNKFLTLLEKYQDKITEFAKIPQNLEELCQIKYVYKNCNFDIKFNYNQKEILQFANAIYYEFIELINNNSIIYDNIVSLICEKINTLNKNQIFNLKDFWADFGIIDPADMNFLRKDIIKTCGENIKKLFTKDKFKRK